MEPSIFRLEELDLTLNSSLRQAQREGWPPVNFGGRGQLWGLLLALAKRYPYYYETKDLRRHDGHVVAEGSLHRAIFDLKRYIKPLGLRVKYVRSDLGYRLEINTNTKLPTKR